MRNAWTLPAILAAGLFAGSALADDAALQAVYARGYDFGLQGHAAALLGRADFATDADYAAYLTGLKDGYARFVVTKPMGTGTGSAATNCGT